MFNFGASDCEYEVKLPKAYKAEILIHSEWEPYGGNVPVKKDAVKVKGQKLVVNVPRFSGMIIKLK